MTRDRRNYADETYVTQCHPWAEPGIFTIAAPPAPEPATATVVPLFGATGPRDLAAILAAPFVHRGANGYSCTRRDLPRIPEPDAATCECGAPITRPPYVPDPRGFATCQHRPWSHDHAPAVCGIVGVHSPHGSGPAACQGGPASHPNTRPAGIWCDTCADYSARLTLGSWGDELDCDRCGWHEYHGIGD